MAKLPNNQVNSLKPSDYAFPDRNSYPANKKSTAAGARAQMMGNPPLGKKGTVSAAMRKMMANPPVGKKADTKLDTLRGKRK
jgi:hypothetical protein